MACSRLSAHGLVLARPTDAPAGAARPSPRPLLGGVGTLAAAYLAGSIPVANLVARRRGLPDLRQVGSGTVSGSALYELAGFRVLALAGCAELAKGAAGPLLARRRPLLGALAAATAIVGHNWSPWLGFKGGRGVSLLFGAGLVLAPEATAVAGAGMAAGKLTHQTGTGTFLGLLGVPLVLARTRRRGALLGGLLIAPIIAKRLVGNDGKIPREPASVLRRLVADRDARATPPA